VGHLRFNPDVDFTYTFNTLGEQTIVQGTGVATTEMRYAFDARGRMTSVLQVQPQENKIAVLSYFDDSRLKSIDRFDGTNGVNRVAKTAYTYDGMGRLQTLEHTGNTAAQAIESHSYSYDSTSRITRIDSSRVSAG
jgi:hypothetical protein